MSTFPARARCGASNGGARAIRALSAAALAGVLACAPARPAGPPSAAPQTVMLEEMTWPELRDAVRQGRTVAIVPIGGTEQSGPALALGKHNARVRALCERIARELGNAVVAPVVAYVPEGQIDPPTSHMRFPGTLSVPNSVFEATLEAAARSLRAHGFRDIVLLGDHGGYQAQLGRVADRLDRAWAGAPARVWAPDAYYEASTHGFAALLREQGYRDDEIGTHAALSDTSLEMALAPQMVREDLLAPGTRFDASVGVYGGDPRRASAALGRMGADLIVSRSVSAIRQLVEHGRQAGTAPAMERARKDGQENSQADP
jgi:creatinine amidohydrolase/Fe(II)-dependent formamide hydrolase-like protein